MEDAKRLVASLSPEQRILLQKMWEDQKANERKAAKKEGEEQQKAAQLVLEQKKREYAELVKNQKMEQEKVEKEKMELKRQEQEKAQQQAILDSLCSQVPITIDVLRTSQSPESQISCSSSVISSLGEEDGMTVKEVVLGKIKSAVYNPKLLYDLNKPYRPRASRERVLFDGFCFVFDKMSYDCKKRFFRCEKKNSCAARIHCPDDSDRVIHKVQQHNHAPPNPQEFACYDVDFGKIRSGHIYPLNASQSSKYIHFPLIPPSVLTPTSDIDENIPMNEAETHSSMDLLAQMITQKDSKRGPVVRLPELFNKLEIKEINEIEMALTRFLLLNQDLRNEFIQSDGDLPILFPNAKKEDLVLFVADFHQEDPLYTMIKIQERNEKSVRSAIEAHLGSKTSRSLLINISSKINIPLSQQMIDQWKTEEFIRIDSSKPNAWKIHHLNKTE